jgi:Ca-activated chloride channel family protein
MARHAVYGDDRPLHHPGIGPAGRIGLSAALLVTVLGAVFLIAPKQALAQLPWSTAGAQCSPEPVDIVVSPELISVVTEILSPLDGQVLADHRCLQPRVRAQEPQETVASAGLLPLDRAPQLWIPDTSVWGQQAKPWKLATVGALASTPVVLATSDKAVKDLGWAKSSPTWYQALRGNRPVAVPDYQAQSESLDALIALWQSLGKGKHADQEVVATVLAADRGEVPTPEAAIADAQSGSVNAPLFPATEQAVAYLNATAAFPHLTAVYPKEGSPVLNYPIYQIGGTATGSLSQGAVRTVIGSLVSGPGQQLIREAGFRVPSGGAPIGSGITTDKVKVLDPPSRTEVDGMVSRVDALAKPSRILTVLDVSLSMSAKLDDGITRIGLAGAAARLGTNLLPDSGSVGLWVFASKMKGNQDYKVLAPVRRLGATSGNGETQRSLLMRLAANADSELSGGGTSLYDTTIAALRNMHASYDPKAANAIIIMSDGANQDSTGATLKDVLDEIHKLNRGKEQVAIFTGGLGPDADYAALRKIALASGGYPYRIDNTAAGQQALLDGLRRSRHLGAKTP